TIKHSSRWTCKTLTDRVELTRTMALSLQTGALFKAARQLLDELPADAVLLITETELDWYAVLDILPADKLLVVSKGFTLGKQAHAIPNLRILDIDPGPTPMHEHISVALLEAVATEKLKTGAHVVVLYNGIGVEHDRPEQV